MATGRPAFTGLTVAFDDQIHNVSSRASAMVSVPADHLRLFPGTPSPPLRRPRTPIARVVEIIVSQRPKRTVLTSSPLTS